ncbi:uncharacterized protein LOC110417326 isoform X1 [Herrania umbratica]|uniref:Uncharacterized protein LOC110417326 isoform X1 n=1 Tax=Herrania umbratica TaxID=108875 RepID=A0A6J1AF73_9ROSI|nr:uncharacterized protein LOC110417326 isoform X1 [Herrania umbratica]XP_021285303.1 uncharacterized protein LOC110417326 isoform X1 [Herrania umbratica]XP_021285310.1 uncharacterized protein LOC110417326 isoform X1 [Herrania umbratica]
MPESQMNFRVETKYWVKKGSTCNFVGRDATILEKKSLNEQNPFSGDGLLPNPYVSFSKNICTAHGIDKPENKEIMCQRIQGEVFVESSQYAATKRFNQSLFQNFSWSDQVGNWETEVLKHSEIKPNHSFIHKNFNCKKEPKTWEEDFTRLHKRPSICEESIQAPFDLHHCKNADEARKVKYNNQHFTTHSSNCFHAYPVSSVPDQQNAHCETKVWVPAQGGFQPCNRMKMQRTSHVLGRSFCGSVGSQPFSGYQVHQEHNLMKAKKWIPVCRKERTGFAGFCNVINDPLPFYASDNSKSVTGSGVYKKYKFRKKTNSETKAKKWIPVQVVERTGDVCNVFSDTSPSSCGEMNYTNLKGNVTPISGSTTSSATTTSDLIATPATKMTSNENETSTLTKDGAIAAVHASESTNGSMIYFEEPEGIPQSIIDSQVAVEALTAAYRLQLESEKAQLEMDQPLAEFERFIHSASPAISFSHSCSKCGVCSVSQLSSSFLCKHQMPSISLRAVWNWYQKPGNYGLEIKAVDYNNQKGRPTEMTSFQAHFIPFLSAIQLFGYVRPEKQEVDLNSSSLETLFVKHSPEAIQPGHFCVGNKTSDKNLDSIEEVCISNNATSCKTGDSQGFLSSLDCLGDSELMFEFFESELPHKRKPLHINDYFDPQILDKIYWLTTSSFRIAELVNTGTSNLVFGDPSKLESVDLHDLHPASWYSVAWYPIYRIPEGNFHASFLTYHSLGHLVQRCIPTDSLQNKATCIVAPVLGLESYNTQGECWFDPRIPDKTSLEEFSQCKTSEIIVKRLRTLEDNAFSFARGCVCKNNVKVFNQQPDYEFFISRKQ